MVEGNVSSGDLITDPGEHVDSTAVTCQQEARRVARTFESFPHRGGSLEHTRTTLVYIQRFST